jgi:sRNA-binding regulator protein Hfq
MAPRLGIKLEGVILAFDQFTICTRNGIGLTS